MIKYKFRARDIKTGDWVEGNLVYVRTVSEKIPIKPMIVTLGGKGGVLWAIRRYTIDEDTIELIKENV